MDRQILTEFLVAEKEIITFEDEECVKAKIEEFKNCNDRYLFLDFISNVPNRVELLTRNEMIKLFEKGIKMNVEVVNTFEEFWTYCALLVIKNCENYSDKAVDIVWSRVQKNNV